MARSTIVGKRVKIIGDHPHAGETGVVDRAERTPNGYGLVIKLEDCPLGVEECFVFRPRQITLNLD